MSVSIPHFNTSRISRRIYALEMIWIRFSSDNITFDLHTDTRAYYKPIRDFAQHTFIMVFRGSKCIVPNGTENVKKNRCHQATTSAKKLAAQNSTLRHILHKLYILIQAYSIHTMRWDNNRAQYMIVSVHAWLPSIFRGAHNSSPCRYGFTAAVTAHRKVME